jgi:hypothetical protein
LEQRRGLEKELLNKDQRRELHTFDRKMRRSNRRFYDNHFVVDTRMLDEIKEHKFNGRKEGHLEKASKKHGQP